MDLKEEKRIQKNPTRGLSVELFGPTIEYLTSPDDTQNNFCILKGTIPPGVSIPLHSHSDTEDFYIISGSLEALKCDVQGHTWIAAKAGDLIHIPGATPHAWRNTWAEPAALIVTTKTMAKFFREVGRQVTSDPQPPTLEELTRFAEVSARYGYWNATPEENARVGIRLSF
jgi:quercetin dioxygenase-like cupin family protein